MTQCFHFSHLVRDLHLLPAGNGSILRTSKGKPQHATTMFIENERSQVHAFQPSYSPFGGPNTFQRTLPVASVQSFWSVPECSVQGWTKSGRHCLQIQNGSKQRPRGEPSGLQRNGSPDWQTNHIMKYCPWSKLWSDQQSVADIEYVEMGSSYLANVCKCQETDLLPTKRTHKWRREWLSRAQTWDTVT